MKMSDAIVWTAWMVQHAEAAEMSARPKGFSSNRQDCRQDFVTDMDYVAHTGNEGFLVDGFQVIAPYVNASKAEIARLGVGLHVPFVDTWSCYKGGELHCGRCGTCCERLEALHQAGARDLTQYEDTTFWIKAVEEYNAKR